MPSYQDIIDAINRSVTLSRDAQVGQMTSNRGLLVPSLDGAIKENKQIEEWLEDENDLEEGNIKLGKTIFGVTGDFEGYVLGDNELFRYDKDTIEFEWNIGEDSTAGSWEREETCLWFLTRARSSTTYYSIVTTDTVDLTGVNKIWLRWACIGANNNIYFNVSTIKMDNFHEYDAQILEDQFFSMREEYLDVSGLTGNHYLRFHLRTRDDKFNGILLERIWLEME